jgi:hypothetical protein
MMQAATQIPVGRRPAFALQLVMAALLSAFLTACACLYLTNLHTAALVHDMTVVVHQVIVHTQQQDDCNTGNSDDADCINDDDAPYDPPPTDA